MENNEVGQQGPYELGMETFRGVPLEELDKRLKDREQDVLDIYLGWLQEQLMDWDLSDVDDLRPRLESWCTSLRFHGLDDHIIFQAFAVWKTNETKKDASCSRRFLVVEEELCNILSPIQTKEQGNSDIIAVKNDGVIDISSDSKDSDLEFLGWKSPPSTHYTTEPVNNTATKYHRTTAPSQEDQPIYRTSSTDRNKSLKRTKSRRKSGTLRRRGPLPKGYVCNRCNEKGKIEYICHLLLQKLTIQTTY